MKFKINLKGVAANVSDAAEFIAGRLGGKKLDEKTVVVTAAGIIEALLKSGKITGVNFESAEQIAEEIAEEIIEAVTGQEIELGAAEADEGKDVTPGEAKAAPKATAKRRR